MQKRISTLSKTLPDESKNSPFIQLCGQLFSEVWFPKDCELEVGAIIDQLIEMLDTPDSAIHNKVCNYLIEFYRYVNTYFNNLSLYHIHILISHSCC